MPTAYVAGLSGPLVGHIIFDVDGDGVFKNSMFNTGALDVLVSTNNDGEFGRAAVDRWFSGDAPTSPTYAFESEDLTDAATGYAYIGLRSPAGATVLSPLVTLLRSVDDDIVPTNLGLGITARQLATFDAVRALSSSDPATAALGRKVTAINIKLTALAEMNQQHCGSGCFFRLREPLAMFAAQIRSRTVDLNSESELQAILADSYRFSRSTEGRDQIAAKALARFGVAADTYLNGPKEAVAVHHALRIVVLPFVERLLSWLQPVNAAAQIPTSASIAASFAELSTIPVPKLVPPNGQGVLVATPDVYDIGVFPEGETAYIDTGCGRSQLFSPSCNDRAVGALTATVGGRTFATSAVRASSACQGRLEVTLLSDGRISLRRLPGATGMCWFEYDTGVTGGYQATGRAYVHL